MTAGAAYAIGDLAALGGVSRRTVRYYVQEGLIPPPLGVGRGNHYTAEHLERLLRVKAMQDAGRTLEEIRRAFAAPRTRTKAGEVVPAEPAIPRTLWRRILLTSGVELHVAGTVRLPPGPRLRELADWCRLHFGEAPMEQNDREEDRDA